MLTASSAPPAACVGERAVGAPDVLADADADVHAADDVQLEVLVARREVAGLVEHGVVRQVALAVGADHLAAGAHGGGVEQILVGVDVADDGGAAAGVLGELAERGFGVLDELRLQHEVLGRIAGDRQLGECHDVATGRLGLVVGGEQLLDVAGEVADSGVELGERHPQHGHDSDVTRPSPHRRSADCGRSASE